MSSYLAAHLALVAVSDNRGDTDRIERVVAAAVPQGLTAVVLREPLLPARRLALLVRSLRVRADALGFLVLVSDRLDVAMAAGAHGAQLGFRALPLSEARAAAPRPFLLGASAHEGDDLVSFARDGADYVFYGPVFDTPSKRGWRNPIGAEGLARAVAASPIPLVAIGGIEPHNAEEVRATGAAGIAVVRALFEAEDPGAAARALRSAP